MQEQSQRLLSEEQNARFDAEFHPPLELAQKVEALRELFGPAGPGEILDAGGGNGVFLDTLLEEFPEANGTLVDVSRVLLDKNSTYDRKTLIEGSIEELSSVVGGRTFDLVLANWLLHHLVGDSYSRCRQNVVRALSSFSGVLRPGGVIVVAENMFDGFFGTNIPSRAIWMITSVSFDPWVRLARRAFNTAGVGVCFRSERNWRTVFAEAGLQIVRETEGRMLDYGRMQRLTPLLGISRMAHRHFYLRPVLSRQ